MLIFFKTTKYTSCYNILTYKTIVKPVNSNEVFLARLAEFSNQCKLNKSEHINLLIYVLIMANDS